MAASGALIGLVWLWTAAPGLAADPPMTLDDLARVRAVTDAQMSPDGRHIAYTLRVPREPFADKNGSPWTELHLVDREGTSRRYVGGKVSVGQVRWAPDSRSVYFLAKRGDDEHKALYAIPVDGGEASVRCRLESDVGSYTLHPDGSRVALISTPPKPKVAEKLEAKGFNAQVFEEARRSAGVHLATLADGGECDPKPLDVEGHVTRARFSPDGERLLLSVVPTPHVDDDLMRTRLRVVDLDGAEVIRIDNLGKLRGGEWSPKGTRVAFIGVDDLHDPREGRLKVADTSTGEIRDLVPDLLGHVRDLSWGIDGRIKAVVHFGVESELWSVDPGTGKHRVLRGQGDGVISSITQSADGKRVAVVADRSTHPGEVFAVARGALERLTDSNPWLAERSLARQEAFEYQAADGLELQGLLVYPLDYVEGKRYPLIIYVHGGPEAHFSNGWLNRYSFPTQMAAGEGYFGFLPNYRGSTGRGVAFSKLDQHGYARPEFDDIVDGKNRLVELGLVDEAKVGITGGSYGGYATAWSSTALSEHYAAGVMFVGVSNLISKFGTSDIPTEGFLVHARAWPWDDWQWMLERSPIFHTDKQRTPLLIMHGDSDPRVHPSQSIEMYRYLKLRGQAPVRLVLYPGEKHGNRKAASQYDYTRRMMRWMRHYLTGEGGEPPPYDLDYSGHLQTDDDDP